MVCSKTLRPIVSSIQSPTSKMSKILCDILTTAYKTDKEYYIKHSFQFAEVLKNIRVLPNHELISLNVVNLFGNITKPLVIKVLNQQWNSSDSHFKYSTLKTEEKRREPFIDMIKVTLGNNYFTHEDNGVPEFHSI